jgi:carboxyl-terminal processing protease
LLELEIIGAYHFQAGTLEAGLSYDKQLLEAERLLKNLEEYNRILHPQP